MKRHLFLLRKLMLVLCVFVIAFLGGVLIGGNIDKAIAKTWTDPRTNYTYNGSWSGSAPKYICSSCKVGWDSNPGSHSYCYGYCSGGGTTSYTCSHGYYSSHQYESGECSGSFMKPTKCEHGYYGGHMIGNKACSGGGYVEVPCSHGEMHAHTIYSTCSGGGTTSYSCEHGQYGSCGVALYTTCSGTPEPAIAYITITSAFYNSNGTLVGNNLTATTYHITYPTNDAYYYIGQGSSSLLYEISGYTFLGWENPSSDIEGSGNNRNVKSSATTDQSITAKYTRNYRTLKISGGEGYFNDTLSATLLQKPVWQNSKIGTKANLDNLTETTETLPTPKRKGWTFTGYKDANGNIVTDNTNENQIPTPTPQG